MYGQDPKNPAKMLGISSEWIEQLAMRAKNGLLLLKVMGQLVNQSKGHASYEPVIQS